MRYTIKSVQQVMDQGEPRLDNYGNLSFKVWVQDGPQGITEFFKNVKPGHEPKAGDVLEGLLTQEKSKAGNLYWKFTAEKPAFQGGFGAGPTSRQEDPDNQDRIMRQHASMDALKYLEIRAAHMGKEELSEIVPSQVFSMAERFLHYYKNGPDKEGHEIFASRNEQDFSDEIEMS